MGVTLVVGCSQTPSDGPPEMPGTSSSDASTTGELPTGTSATTEVLADTDTTDELTATVAGESTSSAPTTGETTGSDSTGGETTGSDSTGGETTSGETTGGETTGNDSTSSETTGSETTGSETTGDADTEDPGDLPPPKPPGLTTYFVGNSDDADIEPSGPGLILMGGSTDVDAAFVWQLQYIAGGDVVVLRASGAGGYNDYLYTEIGGVDSVETLLVTSQALAHEPYVAWKIAQAEAVFIAGGDQAKYMEAWKDTPVATALTTVWERGGVIGGTSAGLAVLGEFVYAAYNGSVIEDEALVDPYNQYMTLDRDFLALPPMLGIVTDSHFTERRRLCRLIGFIGRLVADGWGEPVVGLGVDERTALVVGPDSVGTVLGLGAVHVLHSAGLPQQCLPGQSLEYANLDWYTLPAGATVPLPNAVPQDVMPVALSASMGALDPEYTCEY